MKAPTDFNDAANLDGPEAVRDAIEHAAPPESVAPEPLPNPLPGVPAFDASLLPDSVRGW